MLVFTFKFVALEQFGVCKG